MKNVFNTKNQSQARWVALSFLTMLSVLGVIISLLSGCAHARVKSWSGNQFKVCGNVWAKQKDIDKIASDRCPTGKLRMISGGEEETGNALITNSQASASMQSEKESCTVYVCE